ncbi:hypothetical protein DPMN_146143 [Dreissena polymorpha]|uniref:Uncharacterized protein n=1 Tax=Dreissena polymorpha TaxID=45954 RepID=A0A9D4F7D4_DREPO|nr:hypothetical protein DPMN_146143 [Dreissena polymorpha]
MPGGVIDTRWAQWVHHGENVKWHQKGQMDSKNSTNNVCSFTDLYLFLIMMGPVHAQGIDVIIKVGFVILVVRD